MGNVATKLDVVGSLPAHLGGLTTPETWPHPVNEISIIETHISWVILTGDWAYKIKKPVKFDFLDFSTLERRRHFCEEELRINRHYSKDLYHSVLPISLFEGRLKAGDDRNVIEYAVKMHQFSVQDELINRTGQLSVNKDQLIRFGEELARSHADAPDTDGGLGNPDKQILLVSDAVYALDELIDDPLLRALLPHLEQWFEKCVPEIKTCLAERYLNGRVRECHGDLHLANLFTRNESIVPFDGLEFDPGLRWTDVCADIAFLAMDLESFGNDVTSHAFVTSWLQESGDYAAMSVFKFFKFYRAIVRARVTAISLLDRSKDHTENFRKLTKYLTLARRYTKDIEKPRLYLMRGLSGSGKSWLAEQLKDNLHAIVIRSDVERRRVPNGGVTKADYSSGSRSNVYRTMRKQAKTVLAAGYSVILDATHLDEINCDEARELAQKSHVPFLIIQTQADLDILINRIRDRRKGENDPSEATVEVLLAQHRKYNELSAKNKPFEYLVHSDRSPDVAEIAREVAVLAHRSA